MILDGKSIRDEIKESLKSEIGNKKYRMDFISVGNNLLIDKYIELKKKFGEDIGIQININKFNTAISGEELRKEIEKIVSNKEVSGVVIQLPLPPHINTKEVLDLISKEKDPDVLGKEAQKIFRSGGSEILPPVVGAVKEILGRNNISLKNKKIVLIGAGRLVGEPISIWLNNLGIEHTTIIKGNNLISYTKDADVIISGAGSPNIIKSDMVKDGVVLIDVGTSNLNGEIVGDIDKSCSSKSSLFSTVPGGVGPVTIAILFKNFTLLNGLK